MIKPIYKIKKKSKIFFPKSYKDDFVLVNKCRDFYEICNSSTGEVIVAYGEDLELVSPEYHKKFWREHIIKHLLKPVDLNE